MALETTSTSTNPFPRCPPRLASELLDLHQRRRLLIFGVLSTFDHSRIEFEDYLLTFYNNSTQPVRNRWGVLEGLHG